MPEALRVTFPFQPRWRPLVLSGEKTTTVRTRRLAAAGDEFELEGHAFRLVGVEPMALRDACARHWRDEGMASPEEFERTWVENHPVRGWRPADTVWLHRFERVGDEGDER